MHGALRDRQINVGAAGLNAKCRFLYDRNNVAGLDLNVLAVVCTRSLAPALLRDASARIERGNLDSFTFVCQGATHRSVACCVLLATMVYRTATIYLTTPRTQRAARAIGLYT